MWLVECTFKGGLRELADRTEYDTLEYRSLSSAKQRRLLAT